MGNVIGEIIDSLKKGQGKRMSDLVKMAIEEGYPSKVILESGLLLGMEQVAEKFRTQEVGIPEILSVTRALEKGVLSLNRYSPGPAVGEVGSVVIGTVIGDIHDIGKNLIKIMMESKGIRVIDLGVDVPPMKFYEETIASKARIVCISGVISKSEEDMRNVVKAFEDGKIRDEIFIMVGGYFMTEEKAINIGADLYTKDAYECAEAAYGYLTSL